jgi:hypothetical protein
MKAFLLMVFKMLVRNLFLFFIIFFLFGCAKEKESFENHSNLQTQATEFPKRKEHHLYHIMVATETEANEVLESLKKGENFEKIAREKSIAPSKEKGGDEGFLPLNILPFPINKKLMALKSGEYTKEFIKTELGFHLFKVAESRDIVTENNIIDKAIMKKELDEEVKKWFEQNKSEVRKLAAIEKLSDDSEERLLLEMAARANEWFKKNGIAWEKLLYVTPSEKDLFVYKEDRQVFIANTRHSYESLGIHSEIIRIMIDHWQAMFAAFDAKIGSASLHLHEYKIILASFIVSPANFFNTMRTHIKLKIKLEKLGRNVYPKMWKYLSS